MINDAQIRMAMAALRWTDKDLAERCGLHWNTIFRMRHGKSSEPGNLLLVQQALEAGGVGFVPEEKGGPGVRYRPD